MDLESTIGKSNRYEKLFTQKSMHMRPSILIQLFLPILPNFLLETFSKPPKCRLEKPPPSLPPSRRFVAKDLFTFISQRIHMQRLHRNFALFFAPFDQKSSGRGICDRFQMGTPLKFKMESHEGLVMIFLFTELIFRFYVGFFGSS